MIEFTDAIKSFETGTILKLRFPNAVRPWQHVLDPLSGYLLLAEKLYDSGPEFSESWNFGPIEANSQSVEWVVNQMASIWGVTGAYSIQSERNLLETTILKLDASKAMEILNWTPRLNLRNALELTVSWERKRLNGGDPKGLIEEQIQEYFS